MQFRPRFRAHGGRPSPGLRHNGQYPQSGPDHVENRPLVIFWKRGTLSPVFSALIFESKDIGSATAFSRVLNGRVLTFQPGDGTLFRDEETGSEWNIFGTAVSGPLVGEQLTPVLAHEFFWFAWAAFQPETRIYQNRASPAVSQDQ